MADELSKELVLYKKALQHVDDLAEEIVEYIFQEAKDLADKYDYDFFWVMDNLKVKVNKGLTKGD